MNLESTFDVGVVIGKFLPPHRGHRFLIETALSRCHHVVVFVCGKPTDPIPASLRTQWLKELVPSADVREIDDRYDENDSRIWAENTIHWLGRKPDAVFTSESYGDAYAAHMGCRHILVDQARTTIPCSGTAIRNQPLEMWDYLDPPLREWFAKRVIVIGAESTGTTTLAQELAQTLQTCWVPEYGREYSSLKQQRGESRWHTEEFLHIAQEQTRRENQAARLANRILIGDTNAYATTFWHRRYMGFSSDVLEAFATSCRSDLYLLTGDEIPFVQDGLRDGEHIRHEMHQSFKKALESSKIPWLLVEGSRQQRLNLAIQAIREHFHIALPMP